MALNIPETHGITLKTTHDWPRQGCILGSRVWSDDQTNGDTGAVSLLCLKVARR